jgi:hypothetical protein
MLIKNKILKMVLPIGITIFKKRSAMRQNKRDKVILKDRNSITCTC